MKKHKLALALAAGLVLLCACGQENDVPDPVLPGSDPGRPSGTPSVEIISSSEYPEFIPQEDTQPPQEGMVHSRLTNEWVEADVAETRPIAVMTPNEYNAQPHYSLSKASVVYEANVEGRMTRLMAIYEDWADLGQIGNVRSLRTYYAYWAFEWDAVILHTGQPFFVDALLAEPNTQTINESQFPDSVAFYRDEGRPRPHNAYVSGQTILDAVDRKGYSLNYRGLADNQHFRFTGTDNQNTLEQYDTDAKSAVYIDMSGCYPVTRCYFDYNAADGLYYRSQYLSGGEDGPHIDAVTGEQLTFKNILVQNIKYEDLGEGYMAFQCQDSTEDGWYFTNGKGIHVNWQKSSDYGATKFYDDYGNEIVLNTGKTMICVVKTGDNFTFR